MKYSSRKNPFNRLTSKNAGKAKSGTSPEGCPDIGRRSLENRVNSGYKASLRKSIGEYAASAKKYIQRRTRSLKERIVTRARFSFGRGVTELEQDEYGFGNRVFEMSVDLTPRVQRSSRRMRIPSKKPNPRSRRSLDSEDPEREEELIKRHTMGRWSFPAAASMTMEVHPEDIVPQKVTPLRPVKRERRRTEPETPVRKKSMSGARRISFGNKDNRGRLSILKRSFESQKSRIPILTRTSSPRTNVKRTIDKATDRVKSLKPPMKTMKPVRNSLVVCPSIVDGKKNSSLREEIPKDRKTLTQLFNEFYRAQSRHRAQPKHRSLPAWKSNF